MSSLRSKELLNVDPPIFYMQKVQKLFLLFGTAAIIPIVIVSYLHMFAVQGQFQEIPTAESVYSNEAINLPSNTGSLIVLIPNEAHESWNDEKHKLLSDKNPYYLPTKITIPQGTSVSFLNADAPWNTPHPHTIEIKDSGGKVVYSSGNLDYSNSSKSEVLPVGNYSIEDTEYEWMKGTITVTDQKSNGSLVVGGFYTPTDQVANNKDNDGLTHPGSLEYYRSEFSKNGFNILSEHNFSYKTCDYCEGKYWPDNKTGDHTLIIFSTDQPLAEAISKLKNLVKDNVYI